jgi:hypothetical protein
MSFDPALPYPYNENWRKAYRYDKDDMPRLSTYQAPGGSPVPFIQESVKLSGGQSVDTGEYPFFGFWSSVPLNEKPHGITVTGFIRGDTYIKNRNALIEALRIRTDDDTPGYIDFPLWGRFPVVIVDWSFDEEGQKNGQCAVSITLSRAGVTVEERWTFEGDGFDVYGKTADAAESLQAAAVDAFEKEKNMDAAALASGFTRFKIKLIGTIGRVQGFISQLNAMTNSVTGITNLIAQGIHAPRDLAQALFGAAASIVAGVMAVKNTADETVSYFRTRDNMKNVLMQFLSGSNDTADMEAVTVRQYVTKERMENLYRTMSLAAAGQLMVQMEYTTYEQALGYWALYERLEESIDSNDPAVYRAVQDMRMAASKELAARTMDRELSKYIAVPVPLLALAHYLGCNDEQLRRFNAIADSFVIRGKVLYV